jgi:hypothetical protein
MKLLSCLSFMLLLTSFGTAPEQAPSNLNETYCNPRFGYCFTYDAAVFNTIPEGINADGITITDPTGLITLESYGSFNPYKLDVATLLEQNLGYLLRNTPAKVRDITQYKSDNAYYVRIETDDAFIKQEMVLYPFYFKVLTVEVRREKKALLKHIMESTRFEKDDAVVIQG